MWPDPLPIESIVKAWEFWSRWSMWDDLMISTCFHDCVRCVWCVWCTNKRGAGGVAQGQIRLQNLWTLPVTFKVLQGTQWHRNFRVGISWLCCHYRHYRHYSHHRHYHVSLIAAGLVSYSPMCSKTSMIHNRHPIGPGHDSQTGSDIIWVSWGPQCFELWCMCNLCNTLKHGESHLGPLSPLSPLGPFTKFTKCFRQRPWGGPSAKSTDTSRWERERWGKRKAILREERCASNWLNWHDAKSWIRNNENKQEITRTIRM